MLIEEMTMEALQAHHWHCSGLLFSHCDICKEYKRRLHLIRLHEAENEGRGYAYCYGCGKQATWLAPDGRCGKCTRLTSDEVTG